MDLTEDTVTPETLLAGTTAHNASGQRITGTASGGGSVEVDNITTGDTDTLQTITVSTTDLVDGVSVLASGQLYLVYE